MDCGWLASCRLRAIKRSILRFLWFRGTRRRSDRWLCLCMLRWLNGCFELSGWIEWCFARRFWVCLWKLAWRCRLNFWCSACPLQSQLNPNPSSPSPSSRQALWGSHRTGWISKAHFFLPRSASTPPIPFFSSDDCPRYLWYSQSTQVSTIRIFVLPAKDAICLSYPTAIGSLPAISWRVLLRRWTAL